MGTRRIRGPMISDAGAVVTTGASYSAVNDVVVVVNKTVGSATTINMPPPTTNRWFIVKDGKGDAATNNITVVPTGGLLIDGAANHVINANFESAFYYFNGTEWNLLLVTGSGGGMGNWPEPTLDNITAHGGGGQGSATTLVAGLNNITTVTSALDSVKLPVSVKGTLVGVVNNGAKTTNMFPATGEQVEGFGTNGPLPMGAGFGIILWCATAGTWQILGQNMPLLVPEAVPGASQTLSPGVSWARSNSGSAMADTLVQAATVPGQLTAITNTDATASDTVSPFAGDTIDGETGLIIPPGCSVLLCSDGGTNSDIVGMGGVPLPQIWGGLGFSTAAAKNSANNTAGFTANANQITGAVEVTLVLDGTLTGPANVQLPNLASVLALIPRQAMGGTYKLRIINSGAGAFAWTVTTNTGWSLNGTMSIANLTWRDFYLTIQPTAANLVSTGAIGTDG